MQTVIWIKGSISSRNAYVLHNMHINSPLKNAFCCLIIAYLMTVK